MKEKTDKRINSLKQGQNSREFLYVFFI